MRSNDGGNAILFIAQKIRNCISVTAINEERWRRYQVVTEEIEVTCNGIVGVTSATRCTSQLRWESCDRHRTNAVRSARGKKTHPFLLAAVHILSISWSDASFKTIIYHYKVKYNESTPNYKNVCLIDI